MKPALEEIRLGVDAIDGRNNEVRYAVKLLGLTSVFRDNIPLQWKFVSSKGKLISVCNSYVNQDKEMDKKIEKDNKVVEKHRKDIEYLVSKIRKGLKPVRDREWKALKAGYKDLIEEGKKIEKRRELKKEKIGKKIEKELLNAVEELNREEEK